ncbi:MAG: hypothetical protein NW226_00485 [Microscillaceae bacterium]|nr:hypothetical protein [Microscillaceae bacterium]
MKDKEFDDLIKGKFVDFQVDRPYDENTWNDQYAVVFQKSGQKRATYWKYLKGGILFIFLGTLCGLMIGSDSYQKDQPAFIKHSALRVPKDELNSGNTQKNNYTASIDRASLPVETDLHRHVKSQTANNQMVSWNKNSQRIQPPSKVAHAVEQDLISNKENLLIEPDSGQNFPTDANLPKIQNPNSDQKQTLTSQEGVVDARIFVEKIDHQEEFVYNPPKFPDLLGAFKTVKVRRINWEKNRLSLDVGLEYAHIWSQPQASETQRFTKPGLMASLNWGRWSLLSGFSKQRISYQLEASQSTLGGLSELPGISADYIRGIKVSFDQYQIPITLRYTQPIRGRWRVILGAGLVFDKNYQENYRFEAEEFLGGGPVRYQILLDKQEAYFHLRNLESSLDIEYRLSPKLSLQSGLAYYPKLGVAADHQKEADYFSYRMRLFYKLWQK